MKDVEFFYTISKCYEELLKKAYDSGKNLDFDYKQYLLERYEKFASLCLTFCIDYINAEILPSYTPEDIFNVDIKETLKQAEIEKSQGNDLSFVDFEDDEEDFDANQFEDNNSQFSFEDDDDYEDIFVADNSQSGVDDIFAINAQIMNGLSPLTNLQSQPVNQQNTSNLSENDIFSQENELMLSSGVKDYLGISNSALKTLNKLGLLKPYGEGCSGSEYYLKKDVEALKNK